MAEQIKMRACLAFYTVLQALGTYYNAYRPRNGLIEQDSVVEESIHESQGFALLHESQATTEKKQNWGYKLFGLRQNASRQPGKILRFAPSSITPSIFPSPLCQRIPSANTDPFIARAHFIRSVSLTRQLYTFRIAVGPSAKSAITCVTNEREML